MALRQGRREQEATAQHGGEEQAEAEVMARGEEGLQKTTQRGGEAKQKRKQSQKQQRTAAPGRTTVKRPRRKLSSEAAVMGRKSAQSP